MINYFEKGHSQQDKTQAVKNHTEVTPTAKSVSDCDKTADTLKSIDCDNAYNLGKEKGYQDAQKEFLDWLIKSKLCLYPNCNCLVHIKINELKQSLNQGEKTE
jgi:hypothetical protein